MSQANAAEASGVRDLASDDLRAKGYSFETKSSVNEVDEYEVRVGDQVIDNVRIDRNQKIIIADDLRNADDATADRLKAWEVELSLFVHQSGQKPSDLRGISYSSVEEPNTAPVIARIAERRGQDSFTVDRDSADPLDQADFADFQAALLGRSTQRLLTDAPVGKQVTSVEVAPGSGGGDDFDLNFFFG